MFGKEFLKSFEKLTARTGKHNKQQSVSAARNPYKARNATFQRRYSKVENSAGSKSLHFSSVCLPTDDNFTTQQMH